MPDARKLTPEEAQDLLIKQQERRKKRQREYRERSVARGCAKVNVFLSPESSEILRHCRDTLGMSVGDILSQALLAFKNSEFGMDNPTSTRQRKPREINTEKGGSLEIPVSNSGMKNYDQKAATKRIVELRSHGLSWNRIAKTLDAEKMPTAKGKKWQTSSVRYLNSRFENSHRPD